MFQGKIKIFADGAKIKDFIELSKVSYIKGFTTNPTLMKKAGIKEYIPFVKEVLSLVKDKPVSFEVITDDFQEMKKQALKLSNYGSNVYVKIPITNTQGESSIPLVRDLLNLKVKVNITAVFTISQIKNLYLMFKAGDRAVVSIFAGRIADTGINPVFNIEYAASLSSHLQGVELLWASTRELLNIIQAEKVGCDIITVQPSILKKMKLISYDLSKFSLDTVKMFYEDASSSGFKL